MEKVKGWQILQVDSSDLLSEQLIRFKKYVVCFPGLSWNVAINEHVFVAYICIFQGWGPYLFWSVNIY